MEASERLDRKRRRPKPRNRGKGRSFFLKPWFLKWLMVYAIPVVMKFAVLVIKVYDFIKSFWN
jgi:hypothetical protein